MKFLFLVVLLKIKKNKQLLQINYERFQQFLNDNFKKFKSLVICQRQEPLILLLKLAIILLFMQVLDNKEIYSMIYEFLKYNNFNDNK